VSKSHLSPPVASQPTFAGQRDVVVIDLISHMG
jgi:hypothetical protein